MTQLTIIIKTVDTNAFNKLEAKAHDTGYVRVGITASKRPRAISYNTRIPTADYPKIVSVKPPMHLSRTVVLDSEIKLPINTDCVTGSPTTDPSNTDIVIKNSVNKDPPRAVIRQCFRILSTENSVPSAYMIKSTPT